MRARVDFLRGVDLRRRQAAGRVAGFAQRDGGIEPAALDVADDAVLQTVERVTRVERGLYFLTSQMKVQNRGNFQAGDLAQGGGSMYSHGLAAIALCEAYAMTHDRKLMGPAQLSLNHIMYAQDPVGGGWRYVPRQPGV